ncbi:OLC1v1038959C1 [Oldenlandia corymbosa var. corymbosa]|uniref:OLC1v1038959C1 n=1 Tax=Oldenlandia corymbosa var. corymbosa TaxID=529605 RepID=A0AAV1D381_OLDCO|nr:OLC1v1038959C1 [Oldenlandia corymbosa var. corymbosa]
MGNLKLQIFLFALCVASILAIANSSNITEVLAGFPDYSEFNKYLSETKLADEINSRQTITVLALSNGAMGTLVSAAKNEISKIKAELSLHVVLDYFDPSKLHDISDGSVLSTTLYQTTGNAPGNLGSVNITDLKGGKVGFGGASPGSPLNSTYVKPVKQIPYNVSVIEISAPIIVPQVLDAAGPSSSNITDLLVKAGCKTFANLITQTGVIKDFESAASKGLTIFAPNDEAFKTANVPDLSKLTSAELTSLLRYHALASYNPTGSLKTQKDPLSTLATNGAAKYGLGVTTAGDSITLDTGVDKSRVASTVSDSPPLVIFTVEDVLLPQEIFGMSPAPAPGPAPETSPSPAPSVAPSPADLVPSPLLSPPAPPTSSPAGSPSEGPSPDSQNSTADKNAAAFVRAPALFSVLVTVSVSLIVAATMS